MEKLERQEAKRISFLPKVGKKGSTAARAGRIDFTTLKKEARAFPWIASPATT
jgi:hypothetical protein